jgi:DNA-binding CsgD family transcriptional regulator
MVGTSVQAARVGSGDESSWRGVFLHTARIALQPSTLHRHWAHAMATERCQRASNVLLGRSNESKVLEDLLAAARRGEGGATVVYGEPGIGKTALIEHIVSLAAEFNVLRTAGNEAEIELAYAGLQELLRAQREELEELPDPQRRAIETALGRAAGIAPDRLLLGLGVLNLVSLVSAKRPVLCVIDDAQWLDPPSAHAITFAARHVSKEAVIFLFAARTLVEAMRGLPELTVTGLGDQDARKLLDSALPARLDDAVVDRIVAETHGNPLAILELPRGLPPSQWAGGFGLPASVTLAGQIEESYRRRFARLPPDPRRLLFIVAADPTGDPAIIWRAADRLGIDERSADALEDDGLVEFGDRVVFHHPLVRSAVYNTATPRQRRDAHAVLAEASDASSDQDRRAWHRALAAVRPDESVADELEASAARALSRGGFAAAGAFLERAVALSVQPGCRARRALRAAQAQHLAGALDAASGLAAIAERGPLDDLDQTQLDVLLGQIVFARNRRNGVSPLVLKAASKLERVDLRLARDAYLEALVAGIFAGHLAGQANLQAVATAARAVPSPDGPTRASDLLMEGLALLVTDGYKTGVRQLKRALSVFRGDELTTDERLRWSWIAGGTAGFIWDHDSWDVLTARHERLARDQGALSVLPITLSTRVGACLFAGEISLARSLVEQVNMVTDALDNRSSPNASLFLAAFCGEDADVRQLVETMGTKDSQSGSEAMALLWARALLCNSRGKYEEAFRVATAALRDPSDLWYSGWSGVELIEAASRTGRTRDAETTMDLLAESTAACGSEWALAVQARCRALLSDEANAEILYQEAVERLEPTRMKVDLARAHLVYGEWLHRRHRNRDARQHLRTAHGLFADCDMNGFADRAEAELLATGEVARKRTVETMFDLTLRERRISEMVAGGASNSDIAEQLFISLATVEYHLTKVYRKLGIRSRTQLANVLRRGSASQYRGSRGS